MKQRSESFCVLCYDGLEKPYKIQGTKEEYNCKLFSGEITYKETVLPADIIFRDVYGIAHDEIGIIFFGKNKVARFFSNGLKECERPVSLGCDLYSKAKTQEEVQDFIVSDEFRESLKDCSETQKDLIKTIFLNGFKIQEETEPESYENVFFYRDIDMRTIHEFDFGNIVYTLIDKEINSKQKIQLKTEINSGEGKSVIIDVFFKNDIAITMLLQTNNEVIVSNISSEFFENEKEICLNIQDFINGKTAIINETMQLVSEDSISFYLMRDKFLKMNQEVHEKFKSKQMIKLKDYYASTYQKEWNTKLYQINKTKTLKEKVRNYKEYTKIRKKNLKKLIKLKKESEYMVV